MVVQLYKALPPMVLLPVIQYDGKVGNQSVQGCAMWLLLECILKGLDKHLLFTLD